ncbi:MAG: hypothetical protein BRC40_00520 [Cyanobacteria bacterium QH_8_48_120]|nr:MAG: hypothetical protein BRC40_00520 [Cyanobacteria bacterium QH_8_48_120]
MLTSTKPFSSWAARSSCSTTCRSSVRRSKRLQEFLGLSFIYVTHNQSEAFAMANRVVVMNQGRVEQIGSPLDTYTCPKTHFVAEFVGNNNLFDGEIIEIDSQIITVRCLEGSIDSAQDVMMEK